MTVLDIVRQYLESNGFDGLYSPSECGCKRDDLAPCGEMGTECMPGYLQPGDDECDFYIGPAKEPQP